MSAGLIERYAEYLPVPVDAAVSLGEGSTPLLRLERVGEWLGVDMEVYVKCEGANPTGSFKDRGMTVAVSEAHARGSASVVCASTGNTSASAAAYAARAGMRCFVLVPEGKIARGKLAQAIMHGAVIAKIRGDFDAGMRIVRQLADRMPISIVNSINPFRLQGQKTAAFEIVEALGRGPDFHCLPVGNAGNITAYWMGYKEYGAAGKTTHFPRMCGYQAAGAAPLVNGAPVDKPETVATAIRIGHPQSWQLAVKASKESNGWFAGCEDDEILEAQRLLAGEGVFCEPASAISLAGLKRSAQSGRIPAGSLVVCTLTGHGLKDPDIAVEEGSKHALIETMDATEDATAAFIGKHSGQ